MTHRKIKNHCYHSSKQYLLEINEKQINKQTERKNRYQIQNKIRTKNVRFEMGSKSAFADVIE